MSTIIYFSLLNSSTYLIPPDQSEFRGRAVLWDRAACNALLFHTLNFSSMNDVCFFLFPIMQWTTVQFWIVSSVTSTILHLKATKRFFLSSRYSDTPSTQHISFPDNSRRVYSFSLLHLWECPPVEMTCLWWCG